MKNAIVYLLNESEKDKICFRKSLELLEKNYLNKFPCDIICFHEKNFDPNEIAFIKKNFNESLLFQEVEFKLPEYSSNVLKEIPEYFPHPDFPQCLGFSMGYRHMCRFFAGEIFNQEILQKYDYVWRLDTDSFILNEIEDDVFVKMFNGDYIYGYINIQNDHEGVIKNLWETSRQYFAPAEKFLQFFDIDREKHFRKVFYTNFEIFNMAWFKSDLYQNFYKYIDASAGIYKYRWGDHVLRYIALNCLSSMDKCLFFNDIAYYHGSLYYNQQYSNTFNE